MLRRIELGVADDVGDKLYRVSRVHAVISELLFDGYDVDHVLLAPTGVFVIEVKWSLSPSAHLDCVLRLSRHLHEVRAGARTVTGLLRPVHPSIAVHPVLVLASPGVPHS